LTTSRRLAIDRLPGPGQVLAVAEESGPAVPP
jgi:hypothetical protein